MYKRQEFPQFPAALSFIMILAPEEARGVLESRAAGLHAQLTSFERALAGADGPLPPRVTLLETEYLRAVAAAELNWVCGIIDELRSGALTWSEEELMAAAKSFLG